VVVGLVVAFMVAMLFNRPMPGSSFMRTTIYVPQAMSFVIVALVWSFLYDPIHGPINAALRGLGFDTIHFLTSTELAMPAIIALSLWRNLGYFMIILLAGMQAIPEELIEASHLDGAGAFQRIVHVIIPQMKNTLFFVGVTWFMGGLQMFTQSYVMTQGGPVQSTRTIVYHMYESAFLSLNIGEASAVAVLMFLFVAVIAVPVRVWSELRSNKAKG
jgi:multiple sugar transport system permease protein